MNNESKLKWAYTPPRRITSVVYTDGTKYYSSRFYELDEKGDIKLGGYQIVMNFFAHKPTAACRFIAQQADPMALDIETIN
jgi:hypothetical protein